MDCFPSIVEDLIPPKMLPPLVASDLLNSVSNKILDLIEQVRIEDLTSSCLK